EAIDHTLSRSADDGSGLGRHQGVITIDREGVAEVARRRDLCQCAIVHEHELHVWMYRLADFVIGECAGGVPLVGALEVIRWVEVVEPATRNQGPVWAEGEEGGGAIAEHQRIAFGRSGRATASDVA